LKTTEALIVRKGVGCHETKEEGTDDLNEEAVFHIGWVFPIGWRDSLNE